MRGKYLEGTFPFRKPNPVFEKHLSSCEWWPNFPRPFDANNKTFVGCRELLAVPGFLLIVRRASSAEVYHRVNWGWLFVYRMGSPGVAVKVYLQQSPRPFPPLHTFETTIIWLSRPLVSNWSFNPARLERKSRPGTCGLRPGASCCAYITII